jgi:hypothetical protein
MIWAQEEGVMGLETEAEIGIEETTEEEAETSIEVRPMWRMHVWHMLKFSLQC